MGLLNLLNLYTKKQTQTLLQKAVAGSKLRGIRPISQFRRFGESEFKPSNKTDFLKAYESYVWVYAAVYANASNLARIPIRIFNYDAKGEKQDEVKQGREFDLINHPNPLQSKYDFIEAVVSSLELTGDAFIELDSAEEPTQMYVLRPDWVKIVGSTKTLVDHYVYDVNGTKIRFEPEEIIHIKYYHPRSELFGLPPIQPGQNSVVLDLYSIAYQKNFFKQGAAVDIAFMSPETLSDDNFRRLKDEIRTEYGGVDRSHLPLLLDSDIKVEEIGVSPDKTLLKEQREMNRNEILAAYGVPPIIVGVLDSATFNNTEQQKQAYWENTEIPKSVKLSDKFNDRIFEADGDVRLEFDFSEVPALQEDSKKQMEVNTGYVKGGVMTPNEVRRRIGLEDIDGGDVLKEPKSEGQGGVVKIAKNTGRGEIKKKAQVRFQADFKEAEKDIFNAMVRDFRTMANRILKQVRVNKSDIIIQKDLLDEAAFSIDEQQPAMQAQLKKAYEKTLAVVIGKNYLDVRGTKLPVVEIEQILKANEVAIAEWAQNMSGSIVETMKGRTTGYLQTAFRENHDIGKVTKNIQRIFEGDPSLRPRDKFPWARTIARTEAGKAVNNAKFQAFEKAGVKKKEWIWSGLDRDWHGEFDGQGPVPMEHVYEGVFGSIGYPHEAGAPAGEVINCACTFNWVP